MDQLSKLNLTVSLQSILLKLFLQKDEILINAKSCKEAKLSVEDIISIKNIDENIERITITIKELKSHNLI